jgi:hypothetical protein
MIPFQSRGNPIWNASKKKQFRVVRCGNDIIINFSMDFLPTSNQRSAVPFQDGQFPSAQGSR